MASYRGCTEIAEGLHGQSKILITTLKSSGKVLCCDLTVIDAIVNASLP